MVSNRCFYAVLALCVCGCANSATTKDDSLKVPETPPSEPVDDNTPHTEAERNWKPSNVPVQHTPMVRRLPKSD